MIPRHSLPFGVGTIFSTVASTSLHGSASEMEKAYADALGVPEVICLPSVRAGIRMTVLAGTRPGDIVVAPAYTCGTVHEALAYAAASLRLADSAPGSFLMSSETIESVAEPGSTILLSEVYGLPYDLQIAGLSSEGKSRLRILDMAMSIPSADRMKQLGSRDVALFSFGWGKPMYAGWGGIACLQDPTLAGKVREIRGRWVIPESFGFRLRRGCSTFRQVVMNQRPLYGFLHGQHLYRFYHKFAPPRNCQGIPSFGDEGSRQAIPPPGRALPPEWTRPMTALNRKLALHNLHHASQNADLRRLQAEVYSRDLVESGTLQGPANNALPQSHFPIRLPAAVRDGMGDYLRGRGVDTGTLFPLPAGLARGDYPHGAAAADEVVTLPLGPTLTVDEVRIVSQRVKEGLRRFGY